MSIKLSGMISGLDTDSMIDELVSAYSKNKDKVYKEQKTLSYKQDSWKELNTKIYKLFSGTLSNMRFSSNYQKKISSVSSTKATVSASTSAVNGIQQMQITSLARAGYLTGAKLNGNYSGDTKMSEFGVTDSTRINVTVDGKDNYIDVTSDMSIDKFVAKLKETGVNASFDSTNQRFFVSSKESGTGHDFSISGNGSAGQELIKNIGLNSVSGADITAYKSYITNAESDSSYMTNLAKNEYLDSLLSNLKSDYAEKNTENNKQIKDNTSQITEYNKQIAFARSDNAAKEKSLQSLSDNITNIEKKIADKQKAIDEETDETKKAALVKDKENLEKNLETANSQLEKYTAIKDRVGSSEDENFNDNVSAFETEIKESVTALEDKNKDLEAKVTENKEAITAIETAMKGTIEGKETYLGAGAFDYSGSEFSDIYSKYEERLAAAKEMVSSYERYESLKSLGDSASDAEKSELQQLEDRFGLTYSASGSSRIEGTDATIYLNGAEFTSSSNNFSINGLTITANAVTEPGETVSITTNNDVDGIYNMVKDFFKEYNALINEMDSSYNAASAGDYEPLTEEEEEDMSDKQIEKWEKKLTDAALRKDDTLSSVISIMKTAMSQGFSVNGTTYNLSSFGIKTLGYFVAADNEKGAYHIDGDPDDSAVSGNADKLKSAIAGDQDTFVDFFSQLTSNLYSQLSKKMAASSLSSAYTIYNDKYMDKQYKQYTKDLKNWDTKIENMREKYEKQFASMESALSSLQSQQSSLSSLLGS